MNRDGSWLVERRRRWPRLSALALVSAWALLVVAMGAAAAAHAMQGTTFATVLIWSIVLPVAGVVVYLFGGRAASRPVRALLAVDSDQEDGAVVLTLVDAVNEPHRLVVDEGTAASLTDAFGDGRR
ncbi:hypothetical protein RN607_05555 [Demequina capsici]|uniref:Phospholipase_D-nuclease N-terminal n=1 Tax=Demequina capsici TaxID=3075620 RepID=A0AA96JBU6_9MICO|nr:hypothetical protein [Demequina sp. PMTSA13]WNM28468.1 hypothetical protein RN607_05555 [Demequina sp. PMTSA13]